MTNEVDLIAEKAKKLSIEEQIILIQRILDDLLQKYRLENRKDVDKSNEETAEIIEN